MKLISLIITLSLIITSCSQRSQNGPAQSPSLQTPGTNSEGGGGGTQGPQGEVGKDGQDGEGGAAGKSFTCSDLVNGKDLNGDGTVDNKDCQQFISSSCAPGATDCIPCLKDSAGKCIVTSNEPPCKATGTCSSIAIADACKGGEFSAPAGCPTSCALWRLEMGGDDKCKTENSSGTKVDVMKLVEDLGWNHQKTDEEVLSYIKDKGVYSENINTCKSDCEENFCVPIKLDAKSNCPDGDFKIPDYYKKMHFTVTTCLQRWHVMEVGSTYLSPWQTITGVLKSSNGKEIEIKEYYTAADSHYCASLYKDNEGNSYYNSADVKIKYSDTSEDTYDWDYPGYNGFEFYDQYEFIPDFSEPFYVIPTNFKGPGLFVFKTAATNKKNGQLNFFIENIFWWDPVVTVEFDFYYKGVPASN